MEIFKKIDDQDGDMAMMIMVMMMMMMMVVVFKRVLNAVRECDAEAIEGEALPIKEINLLHKMMMTAMTTNFYSFYDDQHYLMMVMIL